jgi:hypothetical protein
MSFFIYILFYRYKMSNKIISNVLDKYKKFKIINEIIEKKIKNAENKCLYPLTIGSYSLNNIIFLIKRIGSDSSYGSVFLSEIKNNKNKYKFATKIQLLTNDTYKELELLKIITNHAIKTHNIHLPLMYNNLECDFFDKYILNSKLPINLLNDEKENKNINKYYSTFVELADGDLGSYLSNNSITFEQLTNILSQCFISILSCHLIKINHYDPHLNNFLYHIIKKNNSCFEYKYKNFVFYIENIGLNWVIWDFGYGKNITLFANNDYMNDYLMFIGALIDYYNTINIFKPYLMNLYDIINNFKTDYELINYLLENKMLFLDKPVGKITATINL